MKLKALFIPLLLSTPLFAQINKPISLHPENPHYFLFRNQPTILTTSAEHYGAVVNTDFDYITYLDELKANGLNYTSERMQPHLPTLGATKTICILC